MVQILFVGCKENLFIQNFKLPSYTVLTGYLFVHILMYLVKKVDVGVEISAGWYNFFLAAGQNALWSWL